MSKKTINNVTFGYYIDEDGLYYYSERNGKTDEVFSINGVASVSCVDYKEMQLLHLAYIDENQQDEDINELDELF